MAGASSFLIAFAKTLSFTLLCGIVGPIFLVLYFVVDDPTAGWLLPWGLIITVGDIALAAALAASDGGTSRWSALRTSSPTARTGLYGTIQKPVAGAGPERGSQAERLAELDDLMRKDLLSTEEYDASRRRILDEI